MTTYSIEPIGRVDTCFPDKFGIPRQAGLASSARGVLTLIAPYNNPDCVEGLEGVSHLWLTFVFHEHLDKAWKPKVRPPRLGGNQKVGVFATRSSFRPNHLGLSLVKLDRIESSSQQLRLHLSGVDLVSGTPIIDIKPYLPYADNVPNAINAIAGETPATIDVEFSLSASVFCQEYNALSTEALSEHRSVDLQQLIVDVLQQDPRPAYHRSASKEGGVNSGVADVREYGIALLDCNIRWCCEELPQGAMIHVLNIQRLSV